MSIPKEDRETLLKRAEDGYATQSDLFLILRGKAIKNSTVSFSEVELIYRRLGISLTEHRFCEFLAATKLAASKKLLSETKLNFAFIEESEFETLYEYLEDSVTSYAKETLKISPRSLMNFSLVTVLIYLLAILVTSNLMIYFYGGDLVGAFLCALLPIGNRKLSSHDPVHRPDEGDQADRQVQGQADHREVFRGHHQFRD